MSKKRQINEIRTDYIEGKIAFYTVTKNFEAIAILEMVAIHINAPIDYVEIDDQVSRIKAIIGG